MFINYWLSSWFYSLSSDEYRNIPLKYEVTGTLLYLVQASPATFRSCRLLKYKLNKHFKRGYKVFLFSKAKATHLGPTQPPRILRKSGSLSKKLYRRDVKLSALFNDVHVQRWWRMNKLVLRKGGSILTIENRTGNISVPMPLLSSQIPQRIVWDWNHASAVRDRTAKLWNLPVTSIHLGGARWRSA